MTCMMKITSKCKKNLFINLINVTQKYLYSYHASKLIYETIMSQILGGLAYLTYKFHWTPPPPLDIAQS